VPAIARPDFGDNLKFSRIGKTHKGRGKKEDTVAGSNTKRRSQSSALPAGRVTDLQKDKLWRSQYIG
jgi:hypothetical protein